MKFFNKEIKDVGELTELELMYYKGYVSALVESGRVFSEGEMKFKEELFKRFCSVYAQDIDDVMKDMFS